MKRFSTFSEPVPHAYTETEIATMSDETLVAAINDAPDWDADLLADLIWRAFPDYSDQWEVGDRICYDAAEKLGLEL